ncbi:MAG: hypothetical protein ACLQVD_01375 [Capsulimonadaceae bacterium]
MTFFSRSRMLTSAMLALCMLVASPSVLPVRGQPPAQSQSLHHKNWFQRHPTMTGIGAAIATHHALKVMARNAKLHGKKLNWAERHPTLTAIGAGLVVRHEIKKHTPQ